MATLHEKTEVAALAARQLHNAVENEGNPARVFELAEYAERMIGAARAHARSALTAHNKKREALARLFVCPTCNAPATNAPCLNTADDARMFSDRLGNARNGAHAARLALVKS